MATGSRVCTLENPQPALTLVLALAFLLLVLLVISAALAGATALFHGPEQAVLSRILEIVVSLLVLTFVFALLFKYVPDAEIGWQDVWLGGLITAVLFTLGKTAIGFYLGQASVGSAYGAAGSLVALLVWVYYSALIMFFGAEFTHAWTTRHSKVTPQPHAIAGAAPQTKSEAATEDTYEFIPLKVLAAMGGRRTRKVCRAQPRAIVRSLTPCFHKRLQSLTLRQRLTRLWTGSIRSRRWCSAWVANGCSRGLLATNRDKLNRHVRGASYQKESGINSPIVTSCVLQARLSMWAVPLSGPAGNSRPHVARRSGARRRPRRSCEVSQSHWVAP
jgi:hypothetical protein